MSVLSKWKHHLPAGFHTRHKPEPPPPARLLVSQLPHVVIENILREIRASSVNELVTAMTVCRDWRNTGEWLLWTHAVLRPDRTISFLEAWSPRRSNRLHSLTIGFFDQDAIIQEEDLSLLPRVIECLHLLEIFSIKLSNMAFESKPHVDLQGIITALPPTTRSLQIEINASFATASGTLTDNHGFTEALHTKFPQLRNLRIFGRLCCAHLFDTCCKSSLKLESIILNSICYSNPFAPCGEHATGNDLVFKASNMVKRGDLPSLHTFTILHQHSDTFYYSNSPEVTEGLCDKTLPRAIQVNDILRERTCTVPVILDPRSHVTSVRLIEDGTSQELCASNFYIARTLEEPDTWCENAAGSEFPPMNPHHNLNPYDKAGPTGRLEEKQRRRRDGVQTNTPFLKREWFLPWYSWDDVENKAPDFEYLSWAAK